MILRDYLKNFKNDFTEEAQIGVFNCLQIIGYARNGDMSGEDFSELDLRMCSLVGKNCSNIDFRGAYITKNLFFFSGHAPCPESINYSPDGRFIISAVHNSIKIWDASTGNYVRALEGHKGYVFDAKYRPDGKQILALTCYEDSGWQGRQFSSSYPEWAVTSYGCEMQAFFATYSPDGKHIISAGVWRDMKVRDSTSGKKISISYGSETRKKRAVYSPDGKHVVSYEDSFAGENMTTAYLISIWDRYTGALLFSTKESSKGKELEDIRNRKQIT